ncbi:related to DPB4 DNA polymerase II (epsilon) 4th subunit [Rhynchosporium graminicola]|uniref:DNA polymerase epsilon subunit D n=1 Tax=Rhynchosporium graminicola TaxID=2792576 RepID=A0A1E1JXU2_9HELO|nr:related to DPB4 DNA polymerase II (epsilon) 4th subunit [Rhynchosporium commune]
MPPRKTDASKVATADEATPGKEQVGVRDGINIEDLNLPKSIVTRLAKGVLPPNTQVQGNAMIATTKSATVFVNYLASHANEHASAANRKTIAPQDVFNALEDLEFPDFRNRLEAELARFNEVQTDKRNAYRSKVANKSAGSADQAEDDVQGDKAGQPAAKKARLDGEEGANGDREAEADVDADETLDADQTEDDDDVPDDEDEDANDEQIEADEQMEEAELKEVEDEALDNGEDSD